MTQNQQLLDLLRDASFRPVIPCDLVKLVREKEREESKGDDKERSTRDSFGRDYLVDQIL